MVVHVAGVQFVLRKSSGTPMLLVFDTDRSGCLVGTGNLKVFRSG